MFNFASGRWDDRTADESVHVPVVPIEGRLGVVVKGSPHAAAAFDLLTWLAGEKWGTRVASASAATTLYRRSQQKDASEWVEPGLDRSRCPRVWPGGRRGRRRDRCGSTHCGFPAGRNITRPWTKRSGGPCAARRQPTATLEAAAERFASISERLGVDRQRAAYRRSLGTGAVTWGGQWNRQGRQDMERATRR